MMVGAKITVADWWYWNQIPVTLGNIAGGFLFTGLPLYWTYRKQHDADRQAPAAKRVVVRRSGVTPVQLARSTPRG